MNKTRVALTQGFLTIVKDVLPEIERRTA